MTILELMEHYGISALPGTGIVLMALIILIVIVMRIDKAITARYPPKPETTAAPTFAPAYAASGDGAAVTAAIAAAVNEYRKSH